MGESKDERIAFDKGYVCAVACLVAGHDEPTIANDVLRANMPDSWDYIDEYDKKILREAGLLPRPDDE